MAARWALVLALLMIPMGTTALAKPPPAPSVAEQAAISRAAERGRLIYAYDQAAWHATDEMMRRIPTASLPADGGWVVEPQGDLLRVTYYGVEGEAIYALFRADMRGSKVVQSRVFAADDYRTLTRETLALVRARQVAMSHGNGKARCTSGPFNVVVLPRQAGQPTSVYLLSSMATAGEYPFGGHYEIDVAPDGAVVSERAFTQACLNMGPPPTGSGGEAIAVISHMLDPTPKQGWSVSGDQIEPVQMN